MFDVIAPKLSSQGLARWVPEVAGLLTAGCVAWLTCPTPKSTPLTWPGMIASAIGYVLLSTLAGLAGSLMTAAVLTRAGPPGALLSRIRLLAAIVWLPPLALFISHKSVWAGVASVMAAWFTAKLFARPATESNDLPTVALFRTFSAMDTLPRVPSPQALGAAACVALGIRMAVIGSSAASALMLAIGSTLVAWSANKFRLIPGTGGYTARSGNRMPLLFVFSILFTLAGFLEGVLGAGSAGEGEHHRKNTSFVSPIGGEYGGVILLTEAPPHPLVVVPRPSIKPGLSKDEPDNPMSVPFTGVYWMFRWPYTQPPPNSYVSRRSPLKSGFRTTDGAPLFMEAHQNFGRLIDLKCCSLIQLAFKSVDESTTLTLILTNTTLAASPALSLGQRAVISTLEELRGGPASAKERVVSFDVPPNPPIRVFDEATIVFNRSFARASAKVEIERFIFVPRR